MGGEDGGYEIGQESCQLPSWEALGSCPGEIIPPQATSPLLPFYLSRHRSGSREYGRRLQGQGMGRAQ